MNKFLLFLSFLFSGFILPYVASGAELQAGEKTPPEEVVRLKDLIGIAVKSNPDILAARLKWEGEIQRYPQAISFDDPVLSYALPVKKVETRLGPQNHILKLSQKLPFWGKREIKGDVVKESVRIAKTEYDKVARNLIIAVKKSFYELFYVQRAIFLAEGNLTVLERFSTVGAADYEQDVTSLNDVLKAQAQYAQASYDLILLKELEEVEVTRLNTLLNRRPDTEIGILNGPVLMPFTYKLDDLYKGVEKTEEIREAGFDIGQKKVLHKLSKYRSYPDFKLGLSYVNVGDAPTAVDGSGRDSFQLMLGMNVPLWRSKNNAAKKEAMLRISEAENRRDSLRNEIIHKVKKEYFKVNNSYRLMKLYSDNLLPQARNAMSIAETLYKSDKGSLSGLLETESIYFNFQTAYYRAFTDYLKGIAELEKVTGVYLN